MLQMKSYDLKGKISGSTTPVPHRALLNNVELTQQQYDDYNNSSLKLNLPVAIGIDFYFKLDIPKSSIQSIDIVFTAKASDKYVLMRCVEDAKYQSQTGFVQAILHVPATVVSDTTGEIRFKAYGNKSVDFEIYGVKVNVYYDDNGMNSYGGTYTYENNGGETTNFIQNKKLEEITTELLALPKNSLTYATFSRVPSHDNV